MAEFPPSGFVVLVKAPAYWEPSASPNPSVLQGYVCNPLKDAIGILVTEGPQTGEVVHVHFAGQWHLEALRELLVRDPNGGASTTEVAILYDPPSSNGPGGYSFAMRADTDAVPMQVALERVASLKRQRDERAVVEARQAAEAAKTEAQKAVGVVLEEAATLERAKQEQMRRVSESMSDIESVDTAPPAPAES